MKRADNEYDDEDYEVQLERNAQSPPMTAEEIKKSEELYNVRLYIKTNFLFRNFFERRSFILEWSWV